MGEVPTHLQPEVAAYERGEMDDDIDREVRLLADLVLARAIPGKYEARLGALIDDGWMSPAGDVTRRGDDPRDLSW